MPTDKVKEVYELISDKGYFKDEAEFRGYVGNPNKRKEVFELIKDDGYFKDQAEFDGYFSDSKKNGFSNPTTPVSKSGGVPTSPLIFTSASESPEGKPKTFGQVGREQITGKAEVPPPIRISTDIDKGVTQKLKEKPTQEDIVREVKIDANSFDDGVMGTLKKAVRRGILTGEQADELTVFEGREDINFNNIAMIQNQLRNLRASDAYERFNKAQGFGEALQIMAENPIILAEQMLESLAAMTTHGQTRILAGTGTGAAMGSVVPVMGTATGATLGAMSGVGLTSLNLEYSNDIISSLQESGIDITNPKDLEKAFSDEKKYSEIREKALTKGVPVALFDMVSAGIAGKIVSKPVKTLTKKVALGTAEVGVQGALGGAGEATSQIVSGQQINAPSILAEVVGEFGGGAPEIAIGAIVHKKKINTEPTKSEYAAAAVATEKGVDIADVLDTYEASELITPEQRVDIQSGIEKAKETLTKVPDSFTDEQKIKSVELLEEKQTIEQSIEGKDPALVENQKARIEEINNELKTIANEPITRTDEGRVTTTEEPIRAAATTGEEGVQETNVPIGEEVAQTVEGEKAKPTEPAQSDKSYIEAQEVTANVSRENPEASVLIQPKGDD